MLIFGAEKPFKGLIIQFYQIFPIFYCRIFLISMVVKRVIFSYNLRNIAILSYLSILCDKGPRTAVAFFSINFFFNFSKLRIDSVYSLRQKFKWPPNSVWLNFVYNKIILQTEEDTYSVTFQLQKGLFKQTRFLFYMKKFRCLFKRQTYLYFDWARLL